MKHPILAGITVSFIGLICGVTLILPALKAVGIIELSWTLVLLPMIIIIITVTVGFLGIFIAAGGITMLAFFGAFLKGLDRSKQQRKLQSIKESLKHDRSDLN